LAAEEISVQAAVIEAPETSQRLWNLAQYHSALHTDINAHQTIRQWVPEAATYCYQTHIAISDQPRLRLDELTDILYNAATLARQPWYPQFLGGQSKPCNLRSEALVIHHQLAWGRFNLGLQSPRYYRQLISLTRPTPDSAVIIARSVNEGPLLPPDARLAYTHQLNGEVLHWREGHLHWHHICCTPGAGLLPGALDRWLINGVRWLGLDSAERNTYREEALQMRNWLQSADPMADLNQ
jgi:hypothetical protein